MKILRVPNFDMLFLLVVTKFFKSELFSCLPTVDHVIKSCKEHINVLKKFLKNLSTNFVLIPVFAKVALELQKELSIAFYPDSYVFMFFEIAQVYLRSAASRAYKGHL